MAAGKKVHHIKTAEAEVSVHLLGKALKITILLRPKLAEQLAFRLAAPKRHQQAIKTRRHL
jgi:hypothetical protein